MKTTIKTIFSVLCFMSTVAYLNAQTSFFETLKIHGPEATYQVYGDVYTNDKGKPAATVANAYLNEIEIHTLENIPSGITVEKVMKKDGKRHLFENYNGVAISAIQQIGFPNTSILYHSGYNRGFVAVDNAVFFITGWNKDLTDFKKIQAVMILDGSAKTASSKKKKKGKFWKQLKDATINQGRGGSHIQEGTSAEYTALMDKNPEQVVRKYLKAMKAKQDAYTLTAEDKANLQKLLDAAAADDAHAKKVNDAYWASPAGQSHRAGYRGNSAGSNNNVTLVNSSNEDVYVNYSGSRNKGTKVPAGGSATWSCTQDAFIQAETITGSTYSYTTTNNKVYSANSGCNTSITIN